MDQLQTDLLAAGDLARYCAKRLHEGGRIDAEELELVEKIVRKLAVRVEAAIIISPPAKEQPKPKRYEAEQFELPITE
jgi:hypothetical protein